MTPSEQIAFIEQEFPDLRPDRGSSQTSFWIPEMGHRGRAVRIKHSTGELKLAATALRFPERKHILPKFNGPAEALRQHVESELSVLEEEALGGSGATGALRTWEFAVQALRALGGKAPREAILGQIRVDRPAFDAENLRKDLTMLSVNDPARFSYRAWETRRGGKRADCDLVFRGDGAGDQTVYELYDPTEHGVWEAFLDESKKMQLRRHDASISDLVPVLAEHQAPFDPDSAADGKRYVARSIAARQGQAKFRKELLDAYGNKCCLSGCAIKDIVEAAHIYPYDGKSTNDLTNGLPLRADLHTLFDLGLIRLQVTGPLTWEVHWSLMEDPEYSKYDGEVLKPLSISPSVKALDRHRKEHAHKWEPPDGAS